MTVSLDRLGGLLSDSELVRHRPRLLAGLVAAILIAGSAIKPTAAVPASKETEPAPIEPEAAATEPEPEPVNDQPPPQIPDSNVDSKPASAEPADQDAAKPPRNELARDATEDAPVSPGPDPTYSPSPLPEPPEPAVLVEFQDEIRKLLELGWASKQQAALAAADAHFQAAEKLCPNDPRAPYAMGLVLLKNNKYEEALSKFDLSSERGDHPYLPATRAAIWLRVLRGSRYYEPAITSLMKFTRTWQQAEPPVPAWVQRDLTHWTGQLIGFLEGPADSSSIETLVNHCRADILSTLSDSQRQLLNDAREEVLSKYAEKATEQERARMEAKKKQEKVAEETKSQIALDASETKQAKKQIEQTAEELEQSTREQIADIDQNLNSLARDYDSWDAQAQRCARAVQAISNDLAGLLNERSRQLSDQQGDDSESKDSSKKTKPKQNSSRSRDRILTINLLIEQKQRERLLYQAEYDRTQVQLREIQRQGVLLTNRRQGLINEYNQRSGKLYKDRESVVAKEKFLERRKREVSRPATGSTAQVRALAQSSKALRTYVDLTVELERQRILNSFSP